jgi:hypothetical protein
MSLESWKEKALPVEARDFSNPEKTWEEALNHAINKWEHLREEELEKHGLVHIKGSRRVMEKEGLWILIDYENCSLCHKSINNHTVYCRNCVLVQTGVVPIDGCDKQFVEFVRNSNPEPMIEILQKSLELIKR